MAALVWDPQSQAWIEPQNVPMRYDQESGAWVETTGMAWDAEAQAWEEKWNRDKAFKGYLMKNGVLQIPNEYYYFYFNNDMRWRTGKWTWIHQYDSAHSLLQVTTTYCNGIAIQFKKPINISAGSRLHMIASRPNFANRSGDVVFHKTLYFDGENYSDKEPNSVTTNSGQLIVNTPYSAHAVDNEHYISDYTTENAIGYLTIRNALQEINGTCNFLIKDIWLE